MDYEKKYKEALRQAEETINYYKERNRNEAAIEDLQEIFPELKESEEERIRKELVNYFTEGREFLSLCSFGRDEIIAWLKKQGEKPQGKSALEANHEQKVDNANKIERKFKVGDWIVNQHGTIRHIEEVDNVGYQTDEGWLTHDCYEKDFHLWNINDAKDGDVLSNGKMIVIFKHFEEPSYRQHIVAYIGLDLGGDIQITDDTWRLGIDKAKPATKEQRELLFQKMHDAGYTFDFDKKELKKIEQKPATMSLDEAIEHCKEKSCGNNACALEHKQLERWLTELKELKEQKSSWSEEDENNLTDTCVAIRKFYHGTNGAQELIDWLQSLKQRATWKPCDNELEVLRLVAEKDGTCLMGLYEQLKKLKGE